MSACLCISDYPTLYKISASNNGCPDYPTLNKISASNYGCTCGKMTRQRAECIETTVTGTGGILKSPHSDVCLEIPNGLHGTIEGYIDLDPKSYLEHIPESECLIAPIPDYTSNARQNNNDSSGQPYYKIKLRHTVTNENDLRFIKVRHGDIHNNTPFTLIPHKHTAQPGATAFWQADREYITITTKHFSQFICSCCKMLCEDNVQAFVFGALRDIPRNGIHADMKVFLCPALFRIMDYRWVCYLKHFLVSFKVLSCKFGI